MNHFVYYQPKFGVCFSSKVLLEALELKNAEAAP